MAKARNYAKEYADFHGKPAQIKERAKRNAARKKMAKKGKVSKGDGKEVDHKRGVKKGNGDSNLQVMSRHANRKKA